MTAIDSSASSTEKNSSHGWSDAGAKGKKKAFTYFSLFKQAGSDWVEDKASRLAASLAFYTMLSIAPLLIVAIRITGFFLKEQAAQGQIKTYAEQTMGTKAAEALNEIVAHAGESGQGFIATIVSIVILIVSASGVFGELQDSLNTIWEVKPRPGRGILTMIRERFFSMVLVLGTAFLLIVSLLATTVLSVITKLIGGEGWIWEVVNFVISFGVVTGLFALIFKYLPDVRTAWRHVWFGAITTGILFTVGKFGLGWYLGRGATTSIYAGFGSLVAMLLWVYYSAQILFFGAEMTQAHARLEGEKIKPTENAVKVTSEERRNLGMVSPGQLAAAVRMQDRPERVVPEACPETPSPGMAIAIAAGGLAVGAVAAGLGGKLLKKRDDRIHAAARRVDAHLALLDDRMRRVVNKQPLPRVADGVRRPAVSLSRSLACSAARLLAKLPKPTA